jgi:DNA-binding LytR/AlgR family response regulator
MMNCIVVDDDEVSRMIVTQLVQQNDELNLVHVCDNAKDAYKILQQGGIDLAFLDIEMPNMTGLELVESLINTLPQVIFITSNPNHAVKAFEYGLVDYIMKPLTLPRFLKAVQKAQANLKKPILDSQTPDDIYVKSDGNIIRIKLNQIDYVEALSDYVIIHAAEKRVVVHSTMKNMEQRLHINDFVRVHRSFIVHINKIDTLTGNNLIVRNKEIPIGASYKNALLEKLKL